MVRRTDVSGTDAPYRQLWSASLGLVLLLTLAAASLLWPRFAAAETSAQTFATANPGAGSVAISGNWQFHTGDNPAWAAPGFDDSSWELLQGDTTWGAQSHPGHTGYAWYRKRIQVSGDSSSLALLLPPVDDVYELYWNGGKIGAYGQFPPHARWWAFGHSGVYSLGAAPASGVLAIRVWKSALSSLDPSTLGGLNAAPLLGDQAVLTQKTLLPNYLREHRQLPRLLIAAVVTVAGLLAMLLFLRDRREWVYLWLSLYLLSDGFTAFQALSAAAYGLSFVQVQLITQFVNAFQDISLWLLLLALFGFNRDQRWRRWTAVLAGLYLAAQALDTATIFFWQFAGLGLQWIDGITTAIYSLTPLYIFFIVAFGLILKRQTALWPVAIAAFLYGLWNFVYQVSGQGIRFTHATLFDHLQRWGLHLGSYTLSTRFLLDTLLFLVLLFTVAKQQFSERRRQAQIELEVKSAREVQHVLIPDESPAIPGLAIASVYKPASELGGDFFQVIPLAGEPGAGALIILGDVSGKGLKAAMTVSLIVGTLRTLAEYTHQPAAILRGLNQRLIGRTESGFVTCLVLHVAVDGRSALANAGHLAPFRDGVELPVSGALPLGIFASAEYEELDFRLLEGETITLYTDGIAEARNSKGELYGFDRIGRLLASRPPLQTIVDTACDFGQQDDITVLSITRVPSAQSHTSTVQLTAQIATS